jgi:3-(3-hydroxy-phenyl)propionate hydroxylase
MTEHAVVIAGGGPTGLMLAGELALAGVDCVVVERRRTQDVEGSRSLGLLSRTIEVLDQRGIADRFLDAGFTVPTHGYGGIRFDVTDLPTRHNYVLALPQKQFEPILADWVTDLGVQILRDRQVTGFVQHDAGVEIELSDDKHLRASYLVGCDGGRSLVRRTAGIDFAGLDPTTSWMIAEVTMDQEPELGFRHDGLGTHALARAADGDPVRVLLTEREVGHSTPPDLDDLRDALITVYGTDFGLRDATWISRFTDATRQAVTYRRGRVLLAGDAAHVHPPQGGQGMQTGIQDAVNLGWKLAQVVDGASPESLLDSYHAERHPVGARVLQNTMAQVTISKPDARHRALRDTMAELLTMDEPRRYIGAMLTALDVHYDLGGGHPLIGRRMPDLDLHTPSGPSRVFAELHDARPVLLNFGEPGGLGSVVRTDRVRLIDAQLVDSRGVGTLELPVIGEVAAPAGVLIRPDGHVAWAGEPAAPELPEALSTWFGAAASAT